MSPPTRSPKCEVVFTQVGMNTSQTSLSWFHYEHHVILPRLQGFDSLYDIIQNDWQPVEPSYPACMRRLQCLSIGGNRILIFHLHLPVGKCKGSSSFKNAEGTQEGFVKTPLSPPWQLTEPVSHVLNGITSSDYTTYPCNPCRRHSCISDQAHMPGIVEQMLTNLSYSLGQEIRFISNIDS